MGSDGGKNEKLPTTKPKPRKKTTSGKKTFATKITNGKKSGHAQKTTSGYRWSRDMWLEQNSNGYYRWRWYVLDDGNERIKYETSGGNTAYKRGSLYVGKLEES